MSNESTGPDSGSRLPRAVLAADAGNSSAISRPYRRRLSNYLLNKRLQLRYVGIVMILSAVLSGTLGYLIWQQESQASSQILASVDTLCESGDAAACAEFRDDLDANLSRHDTGLVLIMGSVGLGLGVVLFLFMVVMTHKVAGPLHKVGAYFDEIRDGKLPVPQPLRKGDQLQDFYARFRTMMEKLRDRARGEAELAQKILAASEKAGAGAQGELGHALDELRSLHKRKDAALS